MWYMHLSHMYHVYESEMWNMSVRQMCLKDTYHVYESQMSQRHLGCHICLQLFRFTRRDDDNNHNHHHL